METVGPLSTGHQASRELVDDHDFAVHLDVIAVALVKVVSLQRVVDQVRPFHVAGRVEALDPGDLLGLADAVVVQVAGPLFLLDLEVSAAAKEPGNTVRLRVLADVIKRRPRDDERRSGFVDQDTVDFVDDRVVQLALRLLLDRRLHVVAQVVEAELVVGSVSDITSVNPATFRRVHLGLDRADGHAQAAEKRAHPFGVAPGEVVVHGDDVNPLALQRVEVGRERGDERLAFAGDHFGDTAGVENHAAHQLDVVMPHLQSTPTRFATGGERLGKQVVKSRSLPEPGAKLRGLRQKLFVAQRLHCRLKRVDLVDHRAHFSNLSLVGVSKETDQTRRHPLRYRSERVGCLVPNLAEQFHCQIRLKTCSERYALSQ